MRADEKILLHPYRDGNGGAERRLVGGVMLNHLGWARVLGLDTGIFGKMADDRHGAFLRQGMERLGIQHHLTLDGAESSFAAVFVDPSGNRAIYMSRGATADLKPDEIVRRHGGFIRRARMISTEISQLPLKTVNALLLHARAHSIPTVLDVDVPPSDACASLGSAREFERALKLATVLKLTKATAREVVGGNDHDALRMAQALRARYGSEAVVITDGARGCAIAAEKTALRVPAFPIKPLDTTGAGDAFLGAMLAGLRWELPWPAIGRLANAAAAVCCKQLGGFPSGFEARELISKLYGADLPSAAPLASSTSTSGPPPATFRMTRSSASSSCVWPNWRPFGTNSTCAPCNARSRSFAPPKPKAVASTSPVSASRSTSRATSPACSARSARSRLFSTPPKPFTAASARSIATTW